MEKVVGLIDETFGEMWRDVRSYAWSTAKTAGVSVSVHWLIKTLGVDPTGTRMGVVMAMVFWGAVMCFFGPHWTNKGFLAGIHGTWAWVNVATPGSAWRLGGWVCWSIALVCLVVLD